VVEVTAAVSTFAATKAAGVAMVRCGREPFCRDVFFFKPPLPGEKRRAVFFQSPRPSPKSRAWGEPQRNQTKTWGGRTWKQRLGRSHLHGSGG
jgi:hypothetical protein